MNSFPIELNKLRNFFAFLFGCGWVDHKPKTLLRGIRSYLFAGSKFRTVHRLLRKGAKDTHWGDKDWMTSERSVNDAWRSST